MIKYFSVIIREIFKSCSIYKTPLNLISHNFNFIFIINWDKNILNY